MFGDAIIAALFLEVSRRLVKLALRLLTKLLKHLWSKRAFEVVSRARLIDLEEKEKVLAQYVAQTDRLKESGSPWKGVSYGSH